MKRILFPFVFFVAFVATAQTKTIRNYPVIGNLNLLSAEGDGTAASAFAKRQTVILQLFVLNPNAGEPVKAGTCALQIELGKNLRLVQSTGKAQWPLPDYIRWTITEDKGEGVLLSGTLVNDLPPDFMNQLSFSVSCVEAGTSLIKAFWTMPFERAKASTVQSVEYTIGRNK